MAWSSDWAPGGNAGPTQGSSGACNVSEWPEGVEPGSASFQTSFKGWQWRQRYLAGRSLPTWGLLRVSSFFFTLLFLCLWLLRLGLSSLAAAKDFATLLLSLYFPSHYSAARVRLIVWTHKWKRIQLKMKCTAFWSEWGDSLYKYVNLRMRTLVSVGQYTLCSVAFTCWGAPPGFLWWSGLETVGAQTWDRWLCAEVSEIPDPEFCHSSLALKCQPSFFCSC